MAHTRKKYLTVREFADHMGISIQAVYLAIWDKRIAYVNGFGNRIAIPHSEVTRFKKRRPGDRSTKVLRRPEFLENVA